MSHIFKAILSDALGSPEKMIPFGDYCINYNDETICPYWDIDRSKDDLNCGVCYYLQSSDDEINKEYIKKDTTSSTFGITLSLLWDQVKMCNINLEDLDDDNRVVITHNTIV